MKIVCATLNAKYIHTNLAIRYLKAYAAPEFDVTLAEYTIKDPILNIVTDLYEQHPDVIGFSCYIWNIEEIIQVCTLLKKVLPSVTIIVGGPEVTYDARHFLDFFDYIIIGEGEKAFKQFLQNLPEKNFKKVSGLAYRQNGEIFIQPPNEKVSLTTVPSPYQFAEDIPHLAKRITYVETSRGCPFTCQFCLSSIEVGVRYFNREKIKDDIRYLMKHGAKLIKFVDRTFNIHRSYAMEMFQFLIDEHIEGTVFQFEITADIMRPEVIEFLNTNAPIGLFRFEIGVQSTNDQVNELVLRKQNFEKLTRTVTLVKNGGKIDQHLDLIAGLPEENYDSFRKTFNDVFALRPEELQLGFLKMLRGTGVRLNATKHNYVFMDKAPYEVLSNNSLSFADIVRMKQVEDVLEKYWNDHRMDETMEYMAEIWSTPFDFFQQFGSFWSKQGWAKIGHQLEDLFRHLHEFLAKNEHLPIIEVLMKYDYLRNQKYKPRKPWWTERTSKQIYRSIIDNPLLLGEEFAELHLNEKDIYKHTMIETIPFDLHHYLKTKEIKKVPSIVLAYFDQTALQTKIFIGKENGA